MAWVTKNHYGSSGQRHYVAGEPTRNFVEEAPSRMGFRRFRDTAEPACGESLIASGTEYHGPKGISINGGLHSKASVSLLQSNICTRCKKAFLATRPDLAAAVALLKAVG
jgi:hypothetical protein